MATLTVKSPARAANSFPEESAAVGGDEFVNTGSELLIIENGDAASMTLTVVTQIMVDGEDLDDKEISVPAGERHLLGPWPENVYNDENGKVQLTYSSVTSLTVGVLKP